MEALPGNEKVSKICFGVDAGIKYKNKYKQCTNPRIQQTSECFGSVYVAYWEHRELYVSVNSIYRGDYFFFFLPPDSVSMMGTSVQMTTGRVVMARSNSRWCGRKRRLKSCSNSKLASMLKISRLIGGFYLLL